MKKTLLLILAVGTFLQAQAQSDTTLYTPVKGDKQFVFGLNTNSVGFTLKKYCTNTFAMRLGISGSTTMSKSGDVTSSTLSLPNGAQVINPDDSKDIYSETRQSNMGLKIGFQKSVFVQKRFETYLGLDLALTNNRFYNKSSNVSYIVNGNTYDRIVETSSSKSQRGMNAGLNTLIGFNYYVASRFAIGAEFWVTPIYFNHGGTVTSESTSWNTTSNTMYNSYGNYTKTQKGTNTIGNSFNGTAQITATLFLCSRK